MTTSFTQSLAGVQVSETGLSTQLNIIDPLTDKRWDDLVARHPRASAFHGRGWLASLKQTYGYQPFVLTSAAPGEALTDGIVACRIQSWLTGTRVVSLPFADHCDPLFSESSSESFRESGHGHALSEGLIAESIRRRCKYLEVRPLLESLDLGNKFQAGESFYFHELDLRPGLEQLFKGLHKDSIQRKIRRAEKEKVSYESGNTDVFIEAFYHLLIITRRRHHLPPQPINWFKNLAANMGGALQIRLARKDGAAIAALLTLRHGKNIIYKYGCSDGAFHQLGGMPFLFWKLIEEGKATGAESLDFGRSEIDNEGLVTFKDKFGTTKRKLTYQRYPQTTRQSAHSWGDSFVARKMFSMLPDGVLSAAGKVLYRHIG